jgi:UPF0716 family protein affecting phage T7 exclusion
MGFLFFILGVLVGMLFLVLLPLFIAVLGASARRGRASRSLTRHGAARLATARNPGREIGVSDS